MAIIKEKLALHKRFMIIDSPVPFTLVANNGTDEVYRMAGAWRLDLWKLLPEKYFKQYPVFELELVYDDTNLGGGSVIVRQSDIDLGEGIAGVNGQDVHITNFSDLPNIYPVTNELDMSQNKIPLEVNISNVDELKKKFVTYTFNSIADMCNKFKEFIVISESSTILQIAVPNNYLLIINESGFYLYVKGQTLFLKNSSFTRFGFVENYEVKKNNTQITLNYQSFIQTDSNNFYKYNNAGGSIVFASHINNLRLELIE